MREHQCTGSRELFQKDIVAITVMDQGLVFRGIKSFIEKGKLSVTYQRALHTYRLEVHSHKFHICHVENKKYTLGI